MFQVKNAKFSDGSLNTLHIESNRISGVIQQQGLEAVGQPALTLATLEEFASLEGQTVDAAGEWLAPGFVDVHVHSRDPGYPDKEDWSSLAQAAFQGGVVALCDMPNTKPPTLDRASVLAKAERAQKSGIDFRLYLGVTADNIDSLAKVLSPGDLPICGLKVYYGESTGGYTFSDLERLGKALAAFPELLIAFHSEDQCALEHSEAEHFDKSVDFSQPASFAVHSQIRSSRAAMISTKAILLWGEQSRRPIHIAHVSTAIELELICAAQARGVRVTSEVAPHHLLLTSLDYSRLGGFAKMNPPIREPAEVEALRQYFARGEIECFATDHAPHTRAEKLVPDYHRCPAGVPGVDFFAQLLFKAARQWGLSDARAECMGATHPAALFGFREHGTLLPGMQADFVWLSNTASVISEDMVRSRCGWTPYEQLHIPVRVEATWHRGRRVFRHS